MAMKIRLTRMGSKKRPFYRVVALDSATRRDGRPVEYLGYYNPMVEPNEIKLDMEKIEIPFPHMTLAAGKALGPIPVEVTNDPAVRTD